MNKHLPKEMSDRNMRKYGAIISIVVLMFLAGCENGIVGTGAKPEPAQKGFAQKGPFEIGSIVLIAIRPGPAYAETTTTTTIVQTEILDSIGNFEFKFEEDTVYDITIIGRHFNEVTGLMSKETMELKNTYYQGEQSTPFVSVNILTHLVHSRINHLISAESGRLLPAAATAQAGQELLDSFRQDLFPGHLSEFNFSNMAVYNLEDTDNISNAVLLFISAAFYQQSDMYDKSSTVEEMLKAIADDLELDGKIESVALPNGSPGGNTTVSSSLDFAARWLDSDSIILNLEDRSEIGGGSTESVPDISFLVDNDADGVTNNIDADDDGDGMIDTEDNKPYEFEISAAVQSVEVAAGGSVEISLQFNLPEIEEGHKIFKGSFDGPFKGKLTGVFPDFVYTPNPGASGADSINYSVTCVPCLAVPDGIYQSDTLTVAINITPAG